jgi:hypothetical protein
MPRRVVSQKLTDVSEEFTASIIMAMDLRLLQHWPTDICNSAVLCFLRGTN